MYGIERERVTHLLTTAGGRIVRVVPYFGGSDAWQKFRYFATKTRVEEPGRTNEG